MTYQERFTKVYHIWDSIGMDDPLYRDVLELYADLLANKPDSVVVTSGYMCDHRFCKGCFAEVSKGDRFCRQCGRELVNND